MELAHNAAADNSVADISQREEIYINNPPNSVAEISGREEININNPPNSVAEINEREEININYPPNSPKKRTEDPVVRVINGRIYDSQNGKTCHQCRQKTRDFTAFCTRLKKGKPCPLTFCHKCLLNRYGEKADEVGKLEDWICPKCRSVCNCSFCMKRKGYQPTGMLAHTAKATGYNSVLELLHNKGSEILEPWSAESSPKKSLLSNKRTAGPNEEGGVAKEEKKGSKRLKCSVSDENQVPVAADGSIVETRPPKSQKIKKAGNDKENELTEANMTEKEVDKGLASDDQDYGNAESRSLESQCKEMQHSIKNCVNDADLDKENAGSAEAKPCLKVRKSKKLAKVHSESSREDIVLPKGRPLAEVAGIELPAEDAGAALQFLEFCNAFSEVLDIKKGQAECVLRDLTRGRVKRHGVHSSPAEFNIKLLTLMEKDMEKEGDAWLQTLKRCIEQSECTLEELPLDFLDRGSSGYDNLEPSEKLKILNFLCDEVLGTEELRIWIDEVAAKFDEKRKENKDIVLAARRKEKLLKQKRKEETAKAMLSASGGTPLSLAEFDGLLSELQTETDKVHAEVLASLELVPKKNQRSDAVRTDHVMFGSNGQIFWKLSGYNSRSNIILQEIGDWNSLIQQDKWFIYNEEEEKVVEKYISSLRNPVPIKHRSDYAEEGRNLDLPDSPGSENCLPQVQVEDEGLHGVL